MEEKSKIKFKPLHEGMGFHPFSDGLPYAPESKSKYNNGAGANAAGRPQFATPNLQGPALAPATNNSPRVTARQLQERMGGSVPQTGLSGLPQREPLSITQHEPLGRANKTTVLKTKVAPIAQTIAPVKLISDKALLRRRAFAYVMDTVIHAGFWLATNLTALFFFKFQLDSEIVRDNLGQFLVFFLISQWMFIALQEVLFENSIGKVFFNLEFKRNHHSLFLRSLVFMVSALFFGAGFFYRPQDKLGEIQLNSKLYA